MSDDRPTAVRLVRAPDLAGAPYAYAATAPAGSRFIALAGACPLAPDGSTAHPGDHVAQAALALENLETALHAAGARLTDVLCTRILVASDRRDDLGAVWDVVRAGFGDHDVPSTLLGVTVLGYEGQLVEIEAVAAVLDEG